MSEFLMCNPAYFDVKYEINDWMKKLNKPDLPLAKRQWSYLHDRLIQSGATLKYATPHGYQVIEIPEDIFFEGAGDALFVGGVLFMGYGFRTSIESHKIVAQALGVDYVSCELVDPRFYHLDTCFFPYDNGLLYYLNAFSVPSQRDILLNLISLSVSRGGITVVPASDEQASEFICNSVVSNSSIITPSKRFNKTFLGYNIYSCEMSEFIKSGGAVKCLTLEL